VTTIDPRQSLVAALQSQLAPLRQRARARPSAAPATAGAGQAAAASMAQRLEAIPAADPDRRRKAVRVYLESELAREFGAPLLNDPQFPQMLDAIQDQMQQDAQVAAAVHALGDLLLAG
jgi:hypothetical protein